MSIATLRRRARALNLRLHVSAGHDHYEIRRPDGVVLYTTLGCGEVLAYLVGYSQGDSAEAWRRDMGE